MAAEIYPDEHAITIETTASISRDERTELRDIIRSQGGQDAWEEAKSELVLGRDRSGGLHLLPLSRSRVHGLKTGQRLSFCQLRDISRNMAAQTMGKNQSLCQLQVASWRTAGRASALSLASKGLGAAKGVAGAGKQIAGAAFGALNPTKTGKQHLSEAAKGYASAFIKTPASIVGGIIKHPLIGILSAPVKVAKAVPEVATATINAAAGTVKISFKMVHEQDRQNMVRTRV